MKSINQYTLKATYLVKKSVYFCGTVKKKYKKMLIVETWSCYGITINNIFWHPLFEECAKLS